jgi:hypothetical protein
MEPVEVSVLARAGPSELASRLIHGDKTWSAPTRPAGDPIRPISRRPTVPDLTAAQRQTPVSAGVSARELEGFCLHYAGRVDKREDGEDDVLG